MRVAVMQPYLFPYWPYVQLISAVDIFVFLDNVQYINRGWMNRNRICLDGNAHLLSFPVEKAPRNNLISQTHFSAELANVVARTRRTLQHAFAHRAFGELAISYFDEVFLPFAGSKNPNFVDVTTHGFISLRSFVPASCQFELASRVLPRTSVSAQDYIVELVKAVGGDTYVNPIGGLSLYQAKVFAAAEIDLLFLNGRPLPYSQGFPVFVPDMSVLDILASFAPEGLSEYLQQYDLIRQGDLAGPSGA